MPSELGSHRIPSDLGNHCRVELGIRKAPCELGDHYREEVGR